MVVENERRITSIQISYDTKSQLDEQGFKNDSYEDVIKRLLEFYITNKPQ